MVAMTKVMVCDDGNGHGGRNDDDYNNSCDGKESRRCNATIVRTEEDREMLWKVEKSMWTGRSEYFVSPRQVPKKTNLSKRRNFVISHS